MIGKLFLHTFQNITHLLEEKNVVIYGDILVNFPRILSTNSTLVKKIKISNLYFHILTQFGHFFWGEGAACH